MSHYLVQQIVATPNVEARTGTAVVGGGGDGRLQELVLRESATGEAETVDADALFVLIGVSPHSDWLPEEIARDADGFLLRATTSRATSAGRLSVGRSRSRRACRGCLPPETYGMTPSSASPLRWGRARSRCRSSTTS